MDGNRYGKKRWTKKLGDTGGWKKEQRNRRIDDSK